MIEVILAILFFSVGVITGFFVKPQYIHNTNITEIRNNYDIVNKQETQTKVFSGQIQLLIYSSSIITNININLKDFTNIQLFFSTQSNLVLSITSGGINEKK